MNAGLPPDYSLVVPAYDEEALLPGTLASLREAMAAVPLRGEIVVCDNNSRDGTAAVARAAGATVVHEPHNQISRARNAGARAARGRFLVFVDADTRVAPALLRAALDALAGGRVVGGGSTLAWGADAGPLAGALAGVWNRLSARARLAAGSFLFVRRDAFEATGGFSEGVYATEEIWFSRALRRWGRPRGLEFVVLRGHPVRTSPRKMQWYSGFTIVGTLALFTLFPFLLRSRRFCWLWYRRPA